MLNLVQRSQDRTWFEKPEGMSDVLHQLLIQRGIASQEEALRFLSPGEGDLRDPFLMRGMREAVDRIQASLNKGERICVYGDYDVDGVCATAILTRYLEGVGAKVRSYLPSRHQEGYGLNESAVRELADETDLMITVDCGISSHELVALAESLGMKMVVTDHHRPPEVLPACPVVDPQIDDHPIKVLCGAGVAFKLVMALGGLSAAMESVDLAALATVADVVPLIDENRAIVRLGLDRINREPRCGIAALCEAAGLSGKELTSGNIAFQLAPRLNAGGRLGSACRALDLLLESDPEKAKELALVLDDENSYRRTVEQQILAEARTALSEVNVADRRILVVAGEGWNTGVIGLVASRLTEQYHYPTMLLSVTDGIATGSCRSIEGVDIYQALASCEEFLIRFGGHTRAAGLTLEAKNIDAVRERLDAYIREHSDPMCYIPRAEYDMELDFSHLTRGLVSELEQLQPTGFGNPAPAFLASARIQEARAVGAEGAHLKLTLENAGVSLSAIRFREGERARTLQAGGRRKILFAPRINTFAGQNNLELELRSLADEEAEDALSSGSRREKCICRKFLTHVLYNGIHSKNVREISLAGLSEWLTGSPQGTLIASADAANAARLADLLPEGSFDVSVGMFPDDARAFNALALYPSAGNVRGYRRIVLTDLVFGDWPEDAEVYILEGACGPEWLRDLPGIEELRESFRALVKLSPRPVFAPSFRQLVELVATGSNLTEIGALASIKVLRHMELLTYNHDDGSFEVNRGLKKNPEDDAVYQTVCQLKGQIG